VFRRHISTVHTVFNITFRSWHSAEEEIPSHVLHQWRLEARELCNTINRFEITLVKIWVHSAANGYFYLCPLCGGEAPTAAEIKRHALEFHLKFKLIPLARIFGLS
jgi:hypothetical protein